MGYIGGEPFFPFQQFFDLSQHPVEGPAHLMDLIPAVIQGNPLGQVPGLPNGPGCLTDGLDRSKAPFDDPVASQGHQHQEQREGNQGPQQQHPVIPGIHRIGQIAPDKGPRPPEGSGPDLLFIRPQGQIEIMIGNSLDDQRLGPPAEHRLHPPGSLFRFCPFQKFPPMGLEGKVHIVVKGPELSFFPRVPIPGFFHRLDQAPSGSPFFVIHPHFQDHTGEQHQDDGQKQGVPQGDPEGDRQVLQPFPSLLQPATQDHPTL